MYNPQTNNEPYILSVLFVTYLLSAIQNSDSRFQKLGIEMKTRLLKIEMHIQT